LAHILAEAQTLARLRSSGGRVHVVFLKLFPGHPCGYPNIPFYPTHSNQLFQKRLPMRQGFYGVFEEVLEEALE
jgi:hypothetical protein